MAMKVEFTDIDINLIDLNEGQIEGLERNPREWTYDDVERLKRSIRQTPELLEARGLIVIEYDFRYVVIGGNMRLTALRSMGAKTAPCIILPKDTPVEDLAAMVIKDNGSFGRWDEMKLKTDWQDCPFVEWGIDVFTYEDDAQKNEKPKDAIDDGKSEFSIVLTAYEFEFVNNALRDVNADQSVAFLQVLGYYEEATE